MPSVEIIGEVGDPEFERPQQATDGSYRSSGLDTLIAPHEVEGLGRCNQTLIAPHEVEGVGRCNQTPREVERLPDNSPGIVGFCDSVPGIKRDYNHIQVPVESKSVAFDVAMMLDISTDPLEEGCKAEDSWVCHQGGQHMDSTTLRVKQQGVSSKKPGAYNSLPVPSSCIPSLDIMYKDGK